MGEIRTEIDEFFKTNNLDNSLKKSTDPSILLIFFKTLLDRFVKQNYVIISANRKHNSRNVEREMRGGRSRARVQ